MPPRQSPSCALCGTDDGLPHRNGRSLSAARGAPLDLSIGTAFIYSEENKIPTDCGIFTYLEMHEIHQLGDFWFQDLHCLLIYLHSIGLLIAFHLRQNGT